MKSMYPKKGRVILHVDMNSFYASVEAAHDPSLKGKPLAIAGNPEERRGIVVTSSYEAREKGVKTTMPLWEAKKLCPHLIVKTPNFPLYREASLKMFAILKEYSDLVEPVSIDEGYVDISESHRIGEPVQIAKQMQNRVKKELDLPCSIGIAPNKFLAKMASDMKKPLGITILRKRDVSNKLWPLKLEEMYGIGKKTAEKLNKIGLYTIKDLALADVLQIKQVIGINGERLKNKANGEDDAPVDPSAHEQFKSIGNSTTLKEDTTDVAEIKRVLSKLASSVTLRMERERVVTWNVQITIRYFDRKTITRSRKLQNFIFKSNDIYETAWLLFQEHWNGEGIRLLGVTAQDLEEKSSTHQQLDLFSYEKEAKKEPLYEVIDRINDKYGNELIKKGLKASRRVDDEKKDKGTSFQKDFLRDLNN
jgi:DNA polymerase-4